MKAQDKVRGTFLRWLPVISLTFSTFIFNTSEFIPIGLLTDIANDFSITESKAGMLITVYAWVVALASLPLMLAFSKTENKKLLLSVVALFIVSHIVSGVSSGYYMLMLSRVGVACAHAIFWSIVTPLAVRVAPEGKRSLALSLIITAGLVGRDDRRSAAGTCDRPHGRLAYDFPHHCSAFRDNFHVPRCRASENAE